MHPTINVIFEEIDFSSPSIEYFDIIDENGNSISQCTGDSDGACGNWLTCLDEKYLPIPRINANDTYIITIQGTSALNPFCTAYHGYSLNVILTITCGGG